MRKSSLVRAARCVFGLSLRTAAALLALAPGHAFAAGPTPPASDPFYAYAGPLKAVAPGTVLRARQVTISAEGALPTLTATQVLYRTTNQLGEPDATVATIIRPPVATGPPKLLSYQTFYDGVASTCRPSYALQGGTQPAGSTASIEEPILFDYVSQGFTVVTSDYEGSTDDYGAGRQSGYATLDAIRAAEYVLNLTPKTSPVGLIGYSGGSIASMWAAELQPAYAPELDLIGVAAGGIPVDFTHNLVYINGSQDWAGAIPAVGIGLMRGYGLRMNQYLSVEGQQIAGQVEQGCLEPGAYPGLTIADLLKPQYQDWQKVPSFVRIFNDSIMGRSGTPREPLLMSVGDADGTGDGVMIARDVQELAYEYCQRGVAVDFHIYDGDNHDEAAVPFEAQAEQFLQVRYSGLPPTNDCDSIPPGNPLTPLPSPASPGPASAATQTP